ncbi:cytochrome c oxidase accessory protein CcoG [Ideonella livida]|uniref:Cytochrome c oxidase accessory protein CcoG n=1 Tax=Ideonella livida TaxID=2707176 RepID=A0A7C9PH10_9BURK|nr:cytochrome c oxidase accessory protein CcoG [Ideonella livida]NDY91469.1 cytochrome c oxidase accessory protein CcoG [Ideonella livida]
MDPRPTPHPSDALLARQTVRFSREARIHPRAVQGRYARWRVAMVWATQGFFYGMPWWNLGDRQALLFDLEAGRYYVGPLVMFPQDFIYLAGLLVLSALLLFFMAAVAGRLWCGYACPQTVYTELFLWLEHRIEGDRQARLRLDGLPWTDRRKGLRRGAKHLAWATVALLTGFTFVGYFTPIRGLAAQLTGADAAWLWFWLLFYAGATYGNAGFLREQMCKYICPYARFQSALIDRDSLIIGYDAARGEPRGKKRDPQQAPRGDCVDCTLCVQVCPTGIDIRHGLQNECIGCAACIDACNGVMDKLQRPRGLIRYATEAGMADGWTEGAMWRRVWRPRVLVYAALLAVLGGALLWQASHRPALRVNLIKDRAALGRLTEDGQVENLYRVQVMNLRERAQTLTLSAGGLPGLSVQVQGGAEVPAAGMATLLAAVRLPAGAPAAVEGPQDIWLDVTAWSDPATPAPPVRNTTRFFIPR